MSITLDRLRAAQRWGRPSGARRTAAGGRRLANALARVGRARSATKAPQRSPRGTRPSSAPPRPGTTAAEPGRTRRRPLSAAPSSTRCLEQAILTPVLNFDQSGTSFGRKLSIFDASERSDRVGRRPHKSIYALRTLSLAHAVIWHGPWACWAEFEAGVTPLHLPPARLALASPPSVIAFYPGGR